jgi:hypothetical protein
MLTSQIFAVMFFVTGRIIKMYYYANKELYIIIINNGGKVICLANFVWGT